MMSELPELYIAVDVEADGPIPGPYSMLSLGMQVVGKSGDDFYFYSELKPISGDFVQEALAVSGLNRDFLLRTAPDPKEVMLSAHRWINKLRKIGRPVFLAAPSVWDGMFIHWYFINFTGKSPFGPTGSGIDLRSFWMGRKKCEWVKTRKGIIKYELGLENVIHSHHAGDDAKELAVIFEAILKDDILKS
ncbi:hypothetical protein ABRQ06_02490 [Pectobacterium aroidearum]